MGPWNFKDYLFPVLVESGKTFLGLGVQGNGPEELNVHDKDSWRGTLQPALGMQLAGSEKVHENVPPGT